MKKPLIIKFENDKQRENFIEEWNKTYDGMGILNKPHVAIFEGNNNTINNLCVEAFETAKEKGWHDQPREMGTILCLIHGEVSEAMEADRRQEGWDRVTEELADVCIRIFDLCGSLNLDLEKAIIEKMEYNKTRSYKHGGKSY